jgi:hypothetical protein
MKTGVHRGSDHPHKPMHVAGRRARRQSHVCLTQKNVLSTVRDKDWGKTRCVESKQTGELAAASSRSLKKLL